MTKKPTSKRILAYLVDGVIISIIVSLFSSISFLNPYMEEYEDLYEDYQEYVMDMNDPMDLLNDVTVKDYTYQLSKYGIYMSITSLVVSFLYFGIFQYYNKGQTVGKAIFKIKVVSNNDNKLSLVQVIIRSAFINSLLTSSLLIMATLFLSKSVFLDADLVIEYLDMAILFISAGMIIYRNDGLGLHDMIAHTKVVFADEVLETNVKEAKIVEDVKEIEEPKEKSTKKSTTRKTKTTTPKKKTVKKEDK